MLIYVISLRNAIVRRERMARMLDSLGIAYEIVDAVDGHVLDLSKYKDRLDDKRTAERRGIGLVRGEIGCFLSHYNLWERMVADNVGQAIILEDDVILSSDFIHIINFVQTLEWRWDVIRFSATFKRRIDRVICPIDNRYRLVRYTSPAEDTAAYAMSLRGARVLCKHCYMMSRPIDNLYEEWWKTNLHFFAVHPPPASQSRVFEESIENERIKAQVGKNKTKLRLRIKHTMLKNFDRYHRYLWNALNSPQRLR